MPILGNEASTEVRALVELNSTPPLMLLIEAGRRSAYPGPHAAYRGGGGRSTKRVDQNRSGLQVTFALIFALVALLVLSAAVADRAGAGEPDSCGRWGG
ncbi:MAG: hypothetical protein WDN04_05115 [Rhodospirillales bacterium]